MTDQPMNGAEPKPAQQLDQASMIKQLDLALDQMCMAALGVVIRGLVVTASGAPIDRLLASIARTTGRLCADSVAGDLQPVLRIRKATKDAFDEGVNATPLKAKPAHPAAMTAAITPRNG